VYILRSSFDVKMKVTLSLMRLSSKLAERLEKYGRYYPSPLTIQHIVEFGNSVSALSYVTAADRDRVNGPYLDD